ncbi:MAG: serpin family protein, partial [Victivallaceae bacterium]
MWKKIMLWSSCCLGTLISFNAVASVELSPSPATMENVSANTVAVAKINAGMLELFALKFQSDDYRNTLMSPGSMQSALGMIYAGSAGKCAQQLEQKIGLDSKYFDYHKALQMGSHGADDTGGSVVNSVNMVAMSGVKKVNAEFERLIKECFSGVIVLFPAGGQEAMIGKINNFVAQKTNKMI